MRRFFRTALIQRFIQSCREEGLRSAARKARIYIAMRLRGLAPSGTAALGHDTAMHRDHMYLGKVWQTLAQKEAFHISPAPAVLRQRRKIALIADMNLPQCRKYRVEQLAGFWETQGVDVGYAHYQDVPRCVSVLQDATHLMEYRLQNTPVTSMYRYEAHRLRLPILYDLDDPLFSVSAYETYQNMSALPASMKLHFLSEAPRYLDMMNGADLITVSTPGMAQHTRLYTRRPVHIRRNFADTLTLEAGAQAQAAAGAAKRQDDVFRLAFASGSQGHEADFAIIQEQVSAFLAAAPQRRLMILGHFDTDFLPTDLQKQVETHPFTTYARYLETLALADCAIMPLANDIFNSCKSAVRVIDAASVGVPSIAGTVSDMAHVIRAGETGLIADEPEAWTTAFEQLARDPDTARKMGNAARADLETRWSGQPEDHIISPEILHWVKG